MIKSPRGTRDLLPPDTALWNFVEAAVRDVFRAYNFHEIRTPIFESTELFARGVGEETEIVSKEMFTWQDGERFNERQMIDSWLEKYRADDPTHVQAGRVNQYATGRWLADLNDVGVIHVLRGIQVPPPSNLPVSREEFVAFAPNVSFDAIDNLKKARRIAKERYANYFGNQAIYLRLVVPANAATSSPWVNREDVEVEGFAGTFFSSSQSLTLRPENTAGIVRAYIEHKLWERGLNKFFSIGPMFRRERPQKGRYRQFYQIDAEVIGPPFSGSQSPVRDAEILELLATLLDRVGITNWTLVLNSVGCAADRAKFNEALRQALAPVVDKMCVDCQRRAVTNPLRVFDCKVPEDQLIIETLPTISQFLDEDCRTHYEQVKEILHAAGHEIKTPFPRMDFDDAIRQYGIDKPDLRLPPFTDVKDCFSPDELQGLAINKDLPVIAIRIPHVGELSRKERDDIRPLFVAKGGARVFEDFKRIETKFPEAAAKVREKVRDKTGALAPDDLLVLVVGSTQSDATGDAHPASKRKVTPAEMAIYASAGLLRVALAQKYADRHKLFQKGDYRFLWVTNFPMFEYDEVEKRWMAAHHPFTSPHDEDMDKLESDPAMVRALAYDVVLNGTELGSGSIRIHRQDVQSRIFHALGMTEEEARSRFGFFLEALEYGTPPHGGIALGLDRIVMILAGADSLREVIPFPKTAAAKDLMMEAPTPVAEGQLRDLGIGVVKK